MNTEFDLFFNGHGIVSQLTSLTTPQIDWVDERWNLTLLDMVRSMLGYTDLPISL